MKRVLGKLLLSPEFQTSIMAGPVRRLIRSTSSIGSYSPQFMLDSMATERPHYAYCLLGAADLAKRLGISRISAIEFGVAGGNGLEFMSSFGKKVERSTGVAIDCYGFDTGEGMPDPEGAKDLPYWFRKAQYRMDQAKLRSKVPDAKLVIGNIRDTVSSFVGEHRPAPIGAIMNDVDYHSSTLESFRLFASAKDHPDSFLPRIFMYFDDIIGGASEMYGPFNGQLAAINEFNGAQEEAKIHLNQNLMPFAHITYRYQIYYAHLLRHPSYERYVGGELQEELEDALRLNG
jgi:hypothetical protein